MNIMSDYPLLNELEAWGNSLSTDTLKEITLYSTFVRLFGHALASGLLYLGYYRYIHSGKVQWALDELIYWIILFVSDMIGFIPDIFYIWMVQVDDEYEIE